MRKEQIVIGQLAVVSIILRVRNLTIDGRQSSDSAGSRDGVFISCTPPREGGATAGETHQVKPRLMVALPDAARNRLGRFARLESTSQRLLVGQQPGRETTQNNAITLSLRPGQDVELSNRSKLLDESVVPSM